MATILILYLRSPNNMVASGVTTDPADPAMRGAGLWGPKIMALFFH